MESLSDSQPSTDADERDFDETKAAAPSKREVITFAQAQNDSLNSDKHSLCNAPTQNIINKRKNYYTDSK